MHVVNQQIINELYSLFNSIFVDSALAKKNRYKFNEKIINDREGPINGSFDHIRKSFMAFRILIFVFVCILEINLNLPYDCNVNHGEIFSIPYRMRGV